MSDKIGIFICVVLLVGCQSVNYQSAADYFKAMHPALADKYKSLEPISMNALRSTVGRYYSGRLSLIRDLRIKFPQELALQKFLAELEVEEKNLFRISQLNLVKLEGSLREGDLLYEYEYKDGEYEETGIIVLNQGNIRKKEIYTHSIEGIGGTSDFSTNENDMVNDMGAGLIFR